MSTKLSQRPPFRAEHLGSLLRPKKVLDTRNAISGSKSELSKVEDEAIEFCVKKQLELGFHAVSDGEYR